jgi:D-alanyl-D-alanine carboxypeptidase/D-alanyl-D-alanine-endopeptidase (penicillin-binding protein 4)
VPVAAALIAVLWCLLTHLPAASAEPPESAVRELRERFDRRLAPLTRQGIAYGVRVVALPGGEVLYSANADGVERPGSAPRAFAPASNMKLITTAAALDAFGKDHVFRTVLGLRGDDLVVIGSGDPSFGDPSAGDASPTAVFAEWAAALKDKGVTEIRGALLLDDTVFDRELTAPGWPKDQLAEWFCAPVGGLNLNTNCLDVTVSAAGGQTAVKVVPAADNIAVSNGVRTGSAAGGVWAAHAAGGGILLRGTVGRSGAEAVHVTVRDPSELFGGALLKVLADNGIRVAGGMRRQRVRAADGSVPAEVSVVAVRESALPAVLSRCNKKSQNLYAECLFKSLGAVHRNPGQTAPDGPGGFARGSAAVGRFLGKLHLADEGHRIVDGSGLSRDNAVTPALICEVLRYMHARPDFEVYRDSLSVAGADGTLSKRLRDPGVKGRVLAKTGYIRGVSALSGYARTAGGDWVAFSMLFNDIKGTTAPVKELEDALCVELVRLGAAPAAAAASGARNRR